MPINITDKVNANANRITALEEHRRDRDRHDDKVLEVIKDIQKDLHAMRLRMEKKISFIGGAAFAFSLIGGGIGAAVTWGFKQAGVNI